MELEDAQVLIGKTVSLQVKEVEVVALREMEKELGFIIKFEPLEDVIVESKVVIPKEEIKMSKLFQNRDSQNMSAGVLFID